MEKIQPTILKGKSILLAGHITESFGPMQFLPEYLLGKCEAFAVIQHPFSYSKIPNSTAALFENGKQSKKLEGPKYKTLEALHYIRDFLQTSRFVRELGSFDLFIGANSFNACTGIIMRRLGRVKKVIFYEFDYTPQRFKNPVMNWVFHRINGFAARHSDAVWDNPPNLNAIRSRQRVDLRKILRVEHGVFLKKIAKPKKQNLHTLVYLGHVTESKGIQIAISALPRIRKEVKDARLAIVGSGPFEEQLKKIAAEKGILEAVDFLGFTTHDFSMQFVPKQGIAIAPYMNDEKGTFKYADPLKVKDYLACGLPVIITRVPSIAEAIHAKKMGIAINYSEEEFTKAALKLLKDRVFYEQCRKNISGFVSELDWENVFGKAFEKTFKLFGW